MPAPAPYFAHGTFEGWEPGLMGSRRAGALDTLRGVFISGTAGLLRDGDQPPDYPGMWIDDVPPRMVARGRGPTAFPPLATWTEFALRS